MLVPTPVILALVVLFTIPVRAYGADVLPQSMQEVQLRSVVIQTCHPVLTDDDRAFAEVVIESVQEEGKQIWAQLLATGLSNYDELLRLTDEILHERLVRAIEAAKMKVAELGCAELERQTEPFGH
jgi:hypothetical protein